LFPISKLNFKKDPKTMKNLLSLFDHPDLHVSPYTAEENDAQTGITLSPYGINPDI